MGTVLTSTICHYCRGRARTEDHVVPRCALPRPMVRLPEWFRAMNVVPACSKCNNDKGAMRSSCGCAQCSRAWGEGERWIVDTYVCPGIWVSQNTRREMKRVLASIS